LVPAGAAVPAAPAAGDAAAGVFGDAGNQAEIVAGRERNAAATAAASSGVRLTTFSRAA
jgi:hypothetical protein